MAHIARHHQHVGNTYLKANPENAEVWLDLIEKTGTTPEGLGMTGHFLYIGRM